MSSINTYEGKDVGDHRGYVITESNIRPPSMRFEASLRDGSKSLFGATLELVKEDIDDWEGIETLDEWLDGWEREYLDGQTSISRAEAIRRWEREQKRNCP